jgi:hypothetical protein
MPHKLMMTAGLLLGSVSAAAAQDCAQRIERIEERIAAVEQWPGDVAAQFVRLMVDAGARQALGEEIPCIAAVENADALIEGITTADPELEEPEQPEAGE